VIFRVTTSDYHVCYCHYNPVLVSVWNDFVILDEKRRTSLDAGHEEVRNEINTLGLVTPGVEEVESR